MSGPGGRSRALDVFRGATIAGMILVNNAGNEAQTWAPLLHADWHGLTPTDLVFPFFLFIVGVAIPFAFARRLEDAHGDRRALYRQIARRALVLVALGLFVTWFPFYTVAWERARVPGILQRIGVVYALASLAYLWWRPRGRVVLAAALLAGYWALMTFVPVPGYGAGDLSPQGNLAAWVDHSILGPHIWRYAPGPGDPEGILSTLPALATALLGLFTGEWLRSPRPLGRKLATLGAAAVPLALAGFAWHPGFPLNKNLWTSSYVLATGGLALAALAATSWAVDLRGWTTWSRPFEVFGKNSILAFVGSSLMAKLFFAIKWPGGDGKPLSLKGHLYQGLFEPALPAPFASLAWALGYVVLWWAVAAWLDRRGTYLKV